MDVKCIVGSQFRRIVVRMLAGYTDCRANDQKLHVVLKGEVALVIFIPPRSSISSSFMHGRETGEATRISETTRKTSRATFVSE